MEIAEQSHPALRWERVDGLRTRVSFLLREVIPQLYKTCPLPRLLNCLNAGLDVKTCRSNQIEPDYQMEKRDRIAMNMLSLLLSSKFDSFPTQSRRPPYAKGTEF